MCAMEKFEFYFFRDLINIQPPFNIPKPSIWVRSGRGFQLWWHINSASPKLLFLYNQIIDKIAIIIKDFLKPTHQYQPTVQGQGIRSKSLL